MAFAPPRRKGARFLDAELTVLSPKAVATAYAKRPGVKTRTSAAANPIDLNQTISTMPSPSNDGAAANNNDSGSHSQDDNTSRADQRTGVSEESRPAGSHQAVKQYSDV